MMSDGTPNPGTDETIGERYTALLSSLRALRAKRAELEAAVAPVRDLEWQASCDFREVADELAALLCPFKKDDYVYGPDGREGEVTYIEPIPESDAPAWRATIRLHEPRWEDGRYLDIDASDNFTKINPTE
jgi:hypothetical protein